MPLFGFMRRAIGTAGRGCWPPLSERSGSALDGWADDHGVQMYFIDPGKPTQNAYCCATNKVRFVLPHPRMLLSDHVVASAKCSRGSLLL